MLLVHFVCLSVLFVLAEVAALARPRFPRSVKTVASSYQYETKFFSQPIDQFGFDDRLGRFNQRYLVSDQFWNAGKPIFFYAGNEGDIAWFCKNTGFMWDIAPEFNAMLIFAEHRYYGQSLPSGSDNQFTYLSSEQALADFAVLIEHVKATLLGAKNSPVVAFGGSYGGMLAAWLRMKYPNVVVGAIAASAPIWQFADLTPCGTSYDIVSNDFKMAGDNCFTNIKSLWGVLQETAEQKNGMELISQIFRLCSPLSKPSDLTVVSGWLSQILFNFAMVNYPYPASFLEDLPAWPVSVACSYLNQPMTGVRLLKGMADVLNLYFNYTGDALCFNVSSQGTSSLGDKGWDYQACTEMLMPFCSSGNSTMFPLSSWNVNEYVAFCKKTWNVNARPDWIPIQFGGKGIKAHSNIVFSNGDLDPWSGSGVLTSLSDTLIAVIIEKGAHHLDLRSSNPADPASVIAARNLEKQNIRAWIGN